MLVIEALNVEEALFTSLIHFRDAGEESTSRNGRVIELPTPVTTVYHNPLQRVVFDAVRDCNPFLHLFESLWMLAGRNELEFVAQFARNMENFSDDGRTLNGAYGHRWRTHFSYDQVEFIIQHLIEAPNSRRAVLSMWDGWSDLTNQSSKDLPCNTQVVFRRVGSELDMTVYNRSNDAIWGAYGANAVHFSYLHEFVAGAIGAHVGVYRQVSNNLHIYPDIPVAAKVFQLAGASPIKRYGHDVHSVASLFMGDATQHELLEDFRHCVEDGYDAISWSPRTEFYTLVALPLGRAWRQIAYGRDRIKAGHVEEGVDRYRMAYELIGSCEADDWRAASQEWLSRRIRLLRDEHDL